VCKILFFWIKEKLDSTLDRLFEEVRYILRLDVVHPVPGSIVGQRKAPDIFHVDFPVQRTQDCQTDIHNHIVCMVYIDVTMGNSLLGDAAGYQELLHGRMSELNDFGAIYFGDGE
jgi:hypothetical protein